MKLNDLNPFQTPEKIAKVVALLLLRQQNIKTIKIVVCSTNTRPSSAIIHVD